MTCNFSNEHSSDRELEETAKRTPQERNELLGYLDNEIGAKPRTEIGVHLKGCAECQDAVESLKEAQILWRQTLRPHALTADFHIRVKNRLTKTVSRRWALRFALAGAAAAGLLIAVVVLITSFRQNPPAPQDSTAPVGASGNEIASRADKQTAGLEQPVTNTPITCSIAMQTEKDHFHILHTKQPMLSIFIKMVKRQVSTGDNTGLNEATAELINLLADTDDEIRGIAAASLGELARDLPTAPAGQADRASELARDRASELARDRASELARDRASELNATESIPELVKLLNDKYAGARGWAAIALTELGAKDKVSQDAIADIKLIRDNSDENYRARAKFALKELGIIESQENHSK